MRLIDADALKETLRKLPRWIVRKDNSHNEGFTYGQVFFAIDAQPERKTEEWTSCSERLPEALEEVLVTSKHGYVYTSRIVHGEFEYGGEVIAWMPLPEPYKEDSDGRPD